MMKRASVLAVAGVVGLAVAGTVTGAAPRFQIQTPSQAAPPVVYAAADDIPEPVRLETFRIVWETVRDHYFDPTFAGVDWTSVHERYRPLVLTTPKSGEFHALLQKMVSELPVSHLRVFAPGQRTGGPAPTGPPPMAPDGVVVRAGDEGILVYAVPEKSPSWEAGLRPGFRVLAVDGTELPDAATIRKSPRTPLGRTRQLLSGAEGTSAQVRVLDAVGQQRAIALPRTVPFKRSGNLAKPELEWRRPSPRVGYVRFDIWGPTLGSKLEPALAELGDTDALIIDIRNNSGGMEPGVNRLMKFLMAEPGLVAVTTKRGDPPSEWRHEGSGTGAYRGKVAVLVDDLSGSASEVFAGVLQENGRAMVLGRTSYGGVLNSTTVQLPTGGTLQYPHSDMRTPKGRRIEGVGVVPDVAVELRQADLLAGKDTVVEEAIDMLTKGAKR
jgi:carboxyl-terminal processing protease